MGCVFMCSIQDDLEHGPILKFQILKSLSILEYECQKLKITVNMECLMKFFVQF